MTKQKKSIFKGVIIGMLIGIMLSSGCVSNGSVTAKEVIRNVLNVYDGGEITSYDLSIDGYITLTTTNSSGTSVVEAPFNATGVVDISNKKLMREDRMVSPFSPETESHLLVYIIEDIIYTGMYSDEALTWTNRTVGSMFPEPYPFDEWDIYSVLELYGGLRTCSDEEIIDEEIVGGVECYVIQAIPDFQLWAQKYGLEWEGSEDIFDAVFVYWVAKDTNYIMKVQQTTTMDMSSVYGFLGGAVTIIQEQFSETIFSDYNSPVTIELPPERPNVQLIGYINNSGIIVIEHIGGESLSNYRIDVKDVNGTLINTTMYQNEEDPWKVGESKYLLIDMLLLKEGDEVQVTIYSIHDEGIKYVLFDGLMVRT